MIDRGIDVNAREGKNGGIALHLLCQHYLHVNVMEVIKLMIGKGAFDDLFDWESSKSSYTDVHETYSKSILSSAVITTNTITL